MRAIQHSDSSPTRRSAIWLVGLVSISLMFGACKGGNSPSAPPFPGAPPAPNLARQLAPVSGSGQSGKAGERLVEPFQVLVTDTAGEPMGGVDVFWKVTEGAGRVDAPLVTIDGEPGMVAVTTTAGNGIAAASFVPSLGRNSVRASTLFAAEQPSFEATGTSQ